MSPNSDQRHDGAASWITSQKSLRIRRSGMFMRTTNSLNVMSWQSTSYWHNLFTNTNRRFRLGLDHLIGTPALKPYMHGYFLSLGLYDTARVIANPFAYAEHREKLLQEKMEKLAETRIRTRKDTANVKVNKALVERLQKDAEKERKREEREERRKKERALERGDVERDVEMEDVQDGEDSSDEETKQTARGKTTLLSDPRFQALFEDPEFEVDEDSREFGLLNPSLAAQREQQRRDGKDILKSKGKTKTAVEEEAEESDRESSDGISRSGSDEDEDGSGSDSEDEEDEMEDSSRFSAKQKGKETERTRDSVQVRRPTKNVRMVSAQPRLEGSSRGYSNVRRKDSNASFGQRRKAAISNSSKDRKTNSDGPAEAEFTWVPSSSFTDAPEPNSRSNGKGRDKKRRGIERFGMGLEKGHTTARDEDEKPMLESEGHGRTKRRMGIRSGSKNAFRGL